MGHHIGGQSGTVSANRQKIILRQAPAMATGMFLIVVLRSGKSIRRGQCYCCRGVQPSSFTGYPLFCRAMMDPGSAAESAASTLPQTRASPCVFTPMAKRLHFVNDHPENRSMWRGGRTRTSCFATKLLLTLKQHGADMCRMPIAALEIHAQGARKTGPQSGPHIGMRRAPVRLA